MLDDANSLQGGTLLLTPLRGADSEVYAVAQGPLSVGGFSYGGKAASVQKNHPTVGRIAGGATVEREAPGQIKCQDQLQVLRDPDYLTAKAIARVINEAFPASAVASTRARWPSTCPPRALPTWSALSANSGLLEVMPDTPVRCYQRAHRHHCRRRASASRHRRALHGNLAIVTSEQPEVSQPAPYSRGKTVVVPPDGADRHRTEREEVCTSLPARLRCPNWPAP